MFFSETGRGATNGREWLEPRNTRNTRKEKSEPRMDTNGHEWVEPQMGANGLNHETHEIHERDLEPRMDTNGLNHETHEIHEKNPEPRMDTNIIYSLYGFIGC